jgi:predicted ATP-grasp superfamily ATP-dependent carboligase
MKPEPSVEFGEQCAVIAGADLNGLGLLRSLASARVPTVVLDTNLRKPTLASRYGRKIRVGSLAGPAFVDELLALRPRFASKPVLLLTQEASVATISEQRDRVSGAYRFTMPSHTLMTTLLDKVKFQALAEELGFPIPKAVRIDAQIDWPRVDNLRFPCVLKPTTKHPGYGARFAKAYKVSDAQRVRDLWAEMRGVVDEVIVQEWIEGQDSDVYFCLQYRKGDQSRVSFVGRKTCQWPPLVGGTACCIPAPEAADALMQLTDRFFEAVGFVGLGSMEYKRDRRDGTFYMVEPTVGRSDYQEEIATLNGVNIPLAAFLGETDQALPDARAVSPPRAWRDPLGFQKAIAAGASDPTLRILPHARICDAYFRAGDPMPYLTMKSEPVTRRLSRLFGSN